MRMGTTKSDVYLRKEARKLTNITYASALLSKFSLSLSLSLSLQSCVEYGLTGNWKVVLTLGYINRNGK